MFSFSGILGAIMTLIIDWVGEATQGEINPNRQFVLYFSFGILAIIEIIIILLCLMGKLKTRKIE
jgi:hypothetical protein